MKRIWTTLKARIEKEWRKLVVRTEGYCPDEYPLRREFRIDPEVDVSEAANGPRDAGRGHGRHRLQWDQGANLGVLEDVALLPESADPPSQVEETDLQGGNAPISIV